MNPAGGKRLNSNYCALCTGRVQTHLDKYILLTIVAYLPGSKYFLKRELCYVGCMEYKKRGKQVGICRFLTGAKSMYSIYVAQPRVYDSNDTN